MLRKLVRQRIFDFEKVLDRARLSGNRGHFSNFDEQEIIEKYIKVFEIDGQSKTVVDIGAADGVRKSNTFGLVLKGWKAISVESDGRNAASLARAYRFHTEAFACRLHVNSSNILDLLRSFSIEKEFGVLNLDIDGCDYWVLDTILTEFRPRLIVSEYNEKIPPPVKFTVNDVPEFRLRHHFFGYSISKLSDLLAKHDYSLLEIEFNNVFIAPAELAGAYSVDIAQAYRKGYVERPDRKDKFKANENMEILHSLSPHECVQFLNEFFAEFENEYQIGLDSSVQKAHIL